MLSKLFGSNVRVKLLRLFVLHTEEAYSAKQIAQDLKLQITSVKKELENLENFGLLKSSENFNNEGEMEDIKNDFVDSIRALGLDRNTNIKQKNRKGVKQLENSNVFYSVNTEFILYEEIKTLLTRSQVLYERDFVKKVSEIGKLKLLILTGIFVNRNESKIDLLIVGKMNKNKLIKLISDLELELGKEVNFTVMENKEFMYRRDITDVFLYDILEGKKVVVIDEIGISQVEY